MNLRPIRDDADHREALKEIEVLWGAADGTPAGDRLDILITLVNAYEEQHYPIDFPDPIQAIRFRLEQEGKDARALIGVIGSRSRVFRGAARRPSAVTHYDPGAEPAIRDSCRSADSAD
jgi:HTH-type transcriptional regulator / antitoxin HigA